MKIFIITGIFPPDIGGPATYVPAIATAFANNGNEVTVLTLSDGVAHDDSQHPFPVTRIRRSTHKLLRWLITLVAILRFARNAEVLFVNGLAMEAALVNKFLRKPLVLKVVGDFAWERAQNYGWIEDDFETFQKVEYGWRVKWLKILRSWWLQQADRVIVPSKYLAKWARHWGVSEDKCSVIYNAVTAVNGVQPAEISLNTARNIVVVGRLVSWKHIDEVLEVMADIDDLGAIIVGDGPERPRLEKSASMLALADRVHFAGYCSQAKTRSLMAVGDYYVLNSSYEGFPHVIVEAMQLGLPVISTSVGGVPEIITDRVNGILVERNKSSLAGGLRSLLDDPELAASISVSAQETISNYFNHLVMETKTEEVLRRATGHSVMPSKN